MDSLANHAWSEDVGATVVESPSEFLLDLREAGKAEVAKVVIGHADAVELLLVAAVAGGHVLVEGAPGVAKTLLAGAVARVLGVRFTRVQFTPDTTPGEIAGSTTRRLGEETFVPGAVFTNVLLADEINRTPPKTQASLLEAMQEGHVTVDGRTRWLPRPFMVIATQNPYEMEGVFPLPESQLDRFLFKIVLDYCSEEEEERMLRLPHRGVTPDVIEEVRPLLDPVRLAKAQAELDATTLPDDVAKYLIAVVRGTRELPNVRLGGSPRSAIHLMSAARARARLAGRDRVTRADVAEMALPVLRHRLVIDGTTPIEAIAAAVAAAA